MKQISELNIETLMKLNVHIPVSNYFDSQYMYNKKFLLDFEKKSFIIRWMNILYYHFNLYCIFLFLKNKQFTFKRFSKNGGYINTDIKMCEYKDYKLIPVY